VDGGGAGGRGGAGGKGLLTGGKGGDGGVGGLKPATGERAPNGEAGRDGGSLAKDLLETLDLLKDLVLAVGQLRALR
jgi:hypothetical protein